MPRYRPTGPAQIRDRTFWRAHPNRPHFRRQERPVPGGRTRSTLNGAALCRFPAQAPQRAERLLARRMQALPPQSVMAASANHGHQRGSSRRGADPVRSPHAPDTGDHKFTMASMVNRRAARMVAELVWPPLRDRVAMGRPYGCHSVISTNTVPITREDPGFWEKKVHHSAQNAPGSPYPPGCSDPGRITRRLGTIRHRSHPPRESDGHCSLDDQPAATPGVGRVGTLPSSGACGPQAPIGARRGPRAGHHTRPISDSSIGRGGIYRWFSGGGCRGFSGRIGAGWRGAGAGAAN
jgi:hypothetical protein